MEWLSKSTKRLLAEMSAGIIFYNVILVILAGLAYLFLLRYSDKQKEAESQKEQEEAAASFVFETDTDEVSSISFSGDDGIL